jgi:O-antigen ligase
MSFASSGLVRGRALSRNAPPVVATGLSSARLAYLPLPVAALLIAMLVPGELDFFLGGLRLSCHRVVLLVFFPVIVLRILMGHGPSWRIFDTMFVGAFAYYALTMPFKVDLAQAVQSGGIIFVEGAGGYLMARMYVRNAQQFLATVKLLFLLALVAGALALSETISSQHVAHHIASQISGVPQMDGGGYRLGVIRAMSVFDHPILYGTFCMTVFALVWFVEPNPLKRLVRAALVGAATVLSLSSAPILGIFLVLAGVFWERVTRQVPNRAWMTIGCLGVVYVVMALAANRPPLKVFALSIALDPSTAWYRTVIWEFGVDNVMNHPWIGLPLGNWDRPSWMFSNTVDNYWLATALWGGLPAAVLIGLSIAVLMRAVHSRTGGGQPGLRTCRYAWTATVLALCMVGATVHYWNTMAVLFAFYVGLGAWMTVPPTGRWSGYSESAPEGMTRAGERKRRRF